MSKNAAYSVTPFNTLNATDLKTIPFNPTKVMWLKYILHSNPRTKEWYRKFHKHSKTLEYSTRSKPLWHLKSSNKQTYAYNVVMWNNTTANNT